MELENGTSTGRDRYTNIDEFGHLRLSRSSDSDSFLMFGATRGADKKLNDEVAQREKREETAVC